MITDLIISTFLACIDAILSLIPNVSLPVPTPGATANIASVSFSMARIIPIITMMELAGVAIGIRLALQGYELALYIYHQFWGSN